MSSLTAPDVLAGVLRQTKELTEIRDANGTILGFFAPVALENAHLYARGAAHFNPTDLQRSKDDKEPGCTTQELLHRLGATEKA